MLKRTTLLFITCFVALCLSAAPAFADMYGTADVEYVGLIRGWTLDLTNYFGSDSMDAGLVSVDITNLSLTGPDSIPSDSYLNLGYEQAFCIDLYDGKPYKPGGEAYNVMSLDAAPDVMAVPFGSSGMGLDKAAYIAELLNTNTYDNQNNAAAVQVAIWEIIDEDYGDPGSDGIPGPSGWSVTKSQGNFYLDTDQALEATIAGLANSMLSALPSTTPATSFGRYTALSSGPTKGYQDVVIVPVPAAILLGLLGLGVAGWKLRKFA